jgi:hypothetical protein
MQLLPRAWLFGAILKQSPRPKLEVPGLAPAISTPIGRMIAVHALRMETSRSTWLRTPQCGFRIAS